MFFLPAIASFIVLSYIVERYFSLCRNIRIAKAIKLPYVVVPLYTATPFWYFCYKAIIPALQKLPTRWTYPWLDFLDPYWSWKLHHEPFARLGNDIIMVVAPGGIIFCTCDPRVITEVASRRWDFCKPIESYVFLDLFGPSLVTREGKSWRAHQKVLAPAFSEKNAKLVWEESLAQTDSMLRSWSEGQVEGLKHISTIREDTMTLPFHVINKAGFGVHLPWSTKIKTATPISTATGVDKVNLGHTLSYRQALQTTITHLFHILTFPDWLLRVVPLGYAKMLRTAHHECVGYLKELMTEKESELQNTGREPSLRSKIDIMSALIGSKVWHQSKSNLEKEEATHEDEEVFTEKAIISNLFVMLIAGHETTATALIVAMMELAVNPAWQRRVQSDLDRIFGDRPPGCWNLYTDVDKTFDGALGATINEEIYTTAVLRLYPPTNIIPKGTRLNDPQIIFSGDDEFTVPGNTAFQFVVNSAHRNPKYWPSGPAPPGKTDDLDQFRPQRWFKEKSTDVPSVSSSFLIAEPLNNEKASVKSEEGVLSKDTSTALFRPFPGSYISFSTGHRRCIGRRFAQVELLAVLAVLFKSYSLELDVEEFADDVTINLMSAEEKKKVWEKAAVKVKTLTRGGMKHHLTMQHKEGKIALRLVKRGEERFT